jgi:adenosylcobinamide-phosphate synthase
MMYLWNLWRKIHALLPKVSKIKMAAVYILLLLFPSAFIIEFYAGSLKYKFHPLNIMARAAVYLEKLFYSVSNGFISGLFFNISTILAISVVFAGISFAAFNISPLLFYAVSLYILSSFLSAGGLRYESLNIYRLLKSKDIAGAQKDLLSLAGRDGGNLCASEISRAVVESVSENTGDGIGSVIFYFSAGLISGLILKSAINYYTGTAEIVFFGVLSAVIYKSVNLLDSLVGYKSEKYEKFGKFSARLDDAANYIPFRLTSFFMLLSVIILSFTLNKSKKRYYLIDGLRSWVRFRKSHPSPNGGQLESITAGALKIKLGGVNYYGGVESKRPVIGFENYEPAGKESIIDAVRIMELTSILLIIFYTATLICVISLKLF